MKEYFLATYSFRGPPVETKPAVYPPRILEAKKGEAAKINKGITLQDCLEEFTKEERLGEDDLWYFLGVRNINKPRSGSTSGNFRRP